MRIAPPLDAVTYAHVTQVVNEAVRTGRSPAEMLNTAGLLLTPAVRRQLKSETAEFLVEELQRWRPAEFLRRSENTPAALYMRIVEWMQAHVAAIRGEQ